MDLYRWEHPEYLYALALVPVLWLIHFLWARWRAKARERFGSQVANERLAPEATKRRHTFKTLWTTL